MCCTCASIPCNKEGMNFIASRKMTLVLFVLLATSATLATSSQQPPQSSSYNLCRGGSTAPPKAKRGGGGVIPGKKRNKEDANVNWIGTKRGGEEAEEAQQQQDNNDRSSTPLFDILRQGRRLAGQDSDEGEYDELDETGLDVAMPPPSSSPLPPPPPSSSSLSSSAVWSSSSPSHMSMKRSAPLTKRLSSLSSSSNSLASSNIILAAAGVTGVAAALAPVIHQNWKYFLSGSCCCMISHGLAVPFDVVKTSIQLSPQRYNKGIANAFWTILLEGGLFAGAGATLVGYGVQGSLKYGLMETFKPYFQTMGLSSLPILVISSALAEVFGSTALTPLEGMRIRKVMAELEKVSEGAAAASSQQQNQSLFSGLRYILMKQIPYTIVKMATFETLKDKVLAAMAQQATGSWAHLKSARFAAMMVCAVIAGFFSAIASQPGDTLLSRSMDSPHGGGGGHGHGHGHADVTSTFESDKQSLGQVYDNDNGVVNHHGSTNKMNHGDMAPLSSSSSSSSSSSPVLVAHGGGSVFSAENGGILSLFCGLKARLVHVTVLVMIQLIIYDTIKSLLGIVTNKTE